MALTLCGIEHPVIAAGIVPPPLNGMGTLTLVASTSTPINSVNLVLAPNSPVFPAGTLPAALRIKVQSTSSTGVYTFWFGGPAVTTGGGEYIAPGESQTKYLPAQVMAMQAPTVISTGTPQIEIEW